MTKRSGFAVKITAFIEADPKDIDAMQRASTTVGAAVVDMRNMGFIGMKIESRFMLSKDIPDEPKAAEALKQPVLQPFIDAESAGRQPTMPPVPPALRRT